LNSDMEGRTHPQRGLCGAAVDEMFENSFHG